MIGKENPFFGEQRDIYAPTFKLAECLQFTPEPRAAGLTAKWEKMFHRKNPAATQDAKLQKGARVTPCCIKGIILRI